MCNLIHPYDYDYMSPSYLMNEPTSEEWLKEADRFEELWNFPKCCGAIDGKHVRVEAPQNGTSKNAPQWALQNDDDDDDKMGLILRPKKYTKWAPKMPPIWAPQ